MSFYVVLQVDLNIKINSDVRGIKTLCVYCVQLTLRSEPLTLRLPEMP